MNTLLQSLEAHAARSPGKIALSGDNFSLTYAVLPEALAMRQTLLREAGAKVLGLRLPNGPEWILWDIAALLSGIICVPIPDFFHEDQISYVAKAAGIDTFITSGGLLKAEAVAGKGIPAGTAKITFTSGTTGAPKGVCLPRDGLEKVAYSLAAAIGHDHAGDHLSVMPLSILLENIAGVYTALVAGATAHLPDPATIGMANPFEPDFSRLISFTQAKNITSMILVPELLRGLMKSAAANSKPLSSLKFVAVGGSKVSPTLLAAAASLDIPVFEGYGLSECGSVVALNTPARKSDGSVGAVLPHVSLDVKDGEIIIRNPIFLGYLGDNPRNETSFATGDLGALEKNGFLKINGRKKNVIITSQGRNISPEWLESVLMEQADIAQVVVYGDNLSYPAAFIVPRAAGLDLSAAVARANMLLPEYAQIKTYSIIPPLTLESGFLTATGRPRRTEIFSHYRSIMTKENEDDLLRQTGS